MKNNKKISLVLNIIIFFSSLIGTLSSLSGADKMMTEWRALLYYTVQSNILSMLVSLFMVLLITLTIYGKIKDIPDFVYIIKFCTTSGIALTFLVFWIFLARLLPVSYYYSVTNITLHTLSPILCIIDTIWFDKKILKNKIQFTYIEPLLYLLFALSMSFLGVTFTSNNDIVPYFFLNYKELGWFKITAKGPGVVYWVMIMLVIVHIISLSIVLMNNMITYNREKKLKNTIDYMI